VETRWQQAQLQNLQVGHREGFLELLRLVPTTRCANLGGRVCHSRRITL